MADYTSRKTTITRVSLFALLGAVLMGYGLLSLEGKEQMLFVGIGIFDFVYAGLISYPLWKKKND